MGNLKALWHQRIRWQQGTVDDLRAYGWRKGVTREMITRQVIQGSLILIELGYVAYLTWGINLAGLLSSTRHTSRCGSLPVGFWVPNVPGVCATAAGRPWLWLLFSWWNWPWTCSGSSCSSLPYGVLGVGARRNGSPPDRCANR